MKKYKIVFILSLFFTFLNAYSQQREETRIFGQVIDKISKKPLPNINIVLKGTSIGTSTDLMGRYSLTNLPRGRNILMASGLGYKTTEKSIRLRRSEMLEVNFEMEEDSVILETVVVSANRSETKRKEAPVIVNVITPLLFENTNSVTLAQGLNFQPGLRVETKCQNCGFQQVRINGLDGPYSQILIDSRPIFSALAGVYGIEQIPANMIERVEVLRGGGSALFGSNAIAGTINIITKEPKSNSLSVSHTTNLIGGDASDNNLFLNASLISEDQKTGVVLFGASRDRGGFDYDGDGFTEIGRLNSKNLGLRAYYNVNIHNKFTMEYHTINEFRRGGNELDKPPHDTDITEQIEHNIHSGNIGYDFSSTDYKHKLSVYLSGQHIDRKSYYGAQHDPNAYGNTNDKTFMQGILYHFSMDKLGFMPAQLTFGQEYNYNEMTDRMPGYDRLLHQKVNTKSLFLQNEWKNENMSILLGGRLDKHNLIKDAIFSPRINIRYSQSPFIGLRAGYSTGFRAPQAFDEDLHITAVGGEVSIIQLAPDLKEERSNTVNFSADFYKTFGAVQANLLLEGFYTHLDNVFLLEKIGEDEQGNILLERRNGSGAVVKGFNVEGKIAPTRYIQFQVGATFQKSTYDKPESWSDSENIAPQRRMFRTPDQYGYFTASYSLKDQLNFSLSGVYTGSMLVQHIAGFIPEDAEVVTPSFFDLSFKIAYNFKLAFNTRLQLNAGVQNIFNSYQNDFDQGPFRDAGYIYGPSLPRTFFAGLKLSL
jgi:outer membrane receptor for ferrienterochelin and colicins